MEWGYECHAPGGMQQAVGGAVSMQSEREREREGGGRGGKGGRHHGAPYPSCGAAGSCQRASAAAMRKLPPRPRARAAPPPAPQGRVQVSGFQVAATRSISRRRGGYNRPQRASSPPPEVRRILSSPFGHIQSVAVGDFLIPSGFRYPYFAGRSTRGFPSAYRSVS